MTDGYPIVSPELTVKALRDSGYKSTAHALAELIDNAIEAHVPGRSPLVEVFAVEEAGVVTSQVRHRVKQIAVLDNGHGMDREVLRRSLKFGDGTRQARTGIGRFGMGLPNSSISQCDRVDVWSWQNGPDNALHTHLDLEEIKGGMTDVPEPGHDPLPELWRNLSEGLSESGTLVVWDRLERVQWRGAAKTLEHTEALIGRIYRRFISDGRTRIRLVPVRDGTPTGEAIDARPNDPLYLLNPTSTPPPFHDRPMFEPFGAGTTGEIGVEAFPVELDGTVHTVTIRASLASDQARRPDLPDSIWPAEHKSKKPGDTPWGKHAGKNSGVSIIRADRELDLDDAWTIAYDPVERWWGVEVDFPTSLDEVFGVTNNKQSAMVFTQLAHFNWKDEAQPGESYMDFKERLSAEADPRLPLIDLVYHLREKLLPRLRSELREQTRGTGTSRKRFDEATEKADTAVRRRAEEGHKGLTDDLGEQKSEDESRQEQLENLTERHRFSKEDAERQIEDTIRAGRRVRMFPAHQPNSPAFFDVEYFPDLLQVVLNMDHPVYHDLVAALEADIDELAPQQLAERLEQAATAFKILMYSWARFEDEQPERSRTRARQMRWDWGTIARQFFDDSDDDE